MSTSTGKVIQKMQIKITLWDTIIYPLGLKRLKLKSLTPSSVGKNVDQVEASYVVGRDIK